MWLDNASDIDILFYEPYARIIADIAKNEQYNPLTVGVFGLWGAGKSTLLKLIGEKLKSQDGIICVTINAWMFESYDDAKTAIMEALLQELKEEVPVEETKKKLGKLIKRVDWFKLGTKAISTLAPVVASVATGNPLPMLLNVTGSAEEIGNTVKNAANSIQSLKDEYWKEEDASNDESTINNIRKFREEFSDALKSDDIKNVVVMIDDLDRCRPERIIEILEVIKLFLSVDRTTFIIAADENVIKYSIREKYPPMNAYVFSINRKQYSTIFTNITNSWYRMDQMQIPAIYEDLFIIGLSIFALDKRVSRRRFKNCWTRDINVSIPVLEYDKWKDTGLQWEKMLGFLTGDHWHIVFRKSEVIYSYREHANRIHLNVQDCDCVCLFSGGLDSFCGAIRLLEEGGSPCLVGHNEYPKLAKRQNLFVRTFQDLYPEQSVKFISFTANSRAPISEKEGILKGSENTSRGRSLLFLCAALSVAGILGENVPVYIPENGFIGLNIPLTGGRKGTCSTRTTHPYFLRQFNGILEQVGIKNTITNFFAYNTKREIVGQVKDTDAFKSCYADTISCSHPCLARYNKKGSKEYPVNCGYCYPCLIRKSSLLDIDEIKKYSYQGEAYDFLIEYEESEKSADLRAVLGSIYRCKHSSDKELKRYIRCVGELTEEEVEKFLSLYKKSIEDLVQLFSADQRMKEYLGL